MLAATVVTTVKYGVIFPNASFKAGWNRLTRVPTPDMRERYAFVKEIAELHHGRVTLRNADGGGALATLSLPRIAAPAG